MAFRTTPVTRIVCFRTQGCNFSKDIGDPSLIQTYSKRFVRLTAPRPRLQRHQNYRYAYAHHPAAAFPEIASAEAAKGLVIHLDERSRTHLLDELTRLQKEKDDAQNDAAAGSTISRSQFKDVCVFHGIPFIGFGILDNMIMIIAGEYIDVKLGAILGISTMAAAALGNLISDLAGVGSAGYVELVASKVGMRPPDLTSAQASTWQVRWGIGLGRSIGIAVGCLIGMFPLLFYVSEEAKSKPSVDSKETQTS